ncbi:MAG TPA: hypothetical protein DEH78_23195 [Solibacterales bacterium]|nr:hypothetical protein [Bryobacterales bacterium]
MAAVSDWASSYSHSLDGDGWDWLAYQSAFAMWRGRFAHRGVDILSLGTAASALLDLYERKYLTHAEQCAQAVRCLGPADSTWDSHMVRWSNLRLTEDGPDDSHDILILISAGAGLRYFRLFWKELVSNTPVALEALRARIEDIARSEFAFPESRSLAHPKDLHPGENLTLAL